MLKIRPGEHKVSASSLFSKELMGTTAGRTGLAPISLGLLGKGLPSGRAFPRKSMVYKGRECQPLGHTEGLPEEVTSVESWDCNW